ncbi:uncharacterized protein MONBRDRAFT_27662 [Monosiga brevicollis MX1]|uniref:DDE Tnp4 domain-containing protein n=1 Tax=Monosiga brevicollis TaxID=81824 RepID=A9V5Y6_MONBE|nr:uncharacterized protein MONBRDRAFT_27662 [Monosiga brevicollis MX1]EDQ87192.1 predicted protein [Monosiga brevicollis MX1]|eukprot:XP_001748135.1 hypothetical protein [Monosiga brevicollis MX1]
MARPGIKFVSRAAFLRDGRFSASKRRAVVKSMEAYGSQLGTLYYLMGLEQLLEYKRAGHPVESIKRAIAVLLLIATQIQEHFANTVMYRIADVGTPHVDFDRFPETAWSRYFGMANAGQFTRLAAALSSRMRSKFSVPLKEALLAFLALFHRSSRLSDVIRLLGVSWTVSKASQIINTFAVTVAQLFQAQLAFDARYFRPDWVEAAASAVAAKHSPLAGICAFIDGTDQPIARPKGNDVQRAFHAGKDEGRCKTPISWSNQASWRNLNSTGQQASRGACLEILLILAPLACYGIASRFAGVMDPRLMMVQKRPVSAYMLTAVLLSNMIVCDDQTNPVAQYFEHKLRIPTLDEYLTPGPLPTS